MVATALNQNPHVFFFLYFFYLPHWACKHIEKEKDIFSCQEVPFQLVLIIESVCQPRGDATQPLARKPVSLPFF